MRQDTDVIFTTLLRLPSGQRIEMAGCAPSAGTYCAGRVRAQCRHFLLTPVPARGW